MPTRLHSKGLQPLLAAVALLALALGMAGLARADQARPEIEQCREHLAGRLGISLDEVQMIRTRPVDFPDSSLGLPEPDQMYTRAVVPGHAAILEACRARDTQAAVGALERHLRNSSDYLAAYLARRQ